ncbi:HesA/MoeB/ThiF family protein [Pseudoalteromonas xiamenensis]|uniref:HesA/MoeB/ThiF family protein n=1 Tax=Pseudoalteromonas xiamenensis TaxID=882626 RepID=A0A975HK16_9GAMM|nr:HesA/MoeB/ThiF family protein [Pseudoalteromonas xiamenensis]QTH70568.1 HesA/MoeB/ThiF family protein [Pseudoalteromonas xiamenensis]
MKLTDKERIRYSRHLLVPDIGEVGQLQLKSAHVVVVGCGGLGSPALLYLAASGIGRLTLIDDDTVELSNLQRQILFKVSHLGQQKAKAAQKVLANLNNDIVLQAHVAKVSSDTIASCLSGADCVLDCSDNFSTRYLINRFCQSKKIPLVAGAAQGTSGQVMAFDFRMESACYECLFPRHSTEEPASRAVNCDTLGVLSPLLGVIGSQQVILCLQIILGANKPSHVAFFDGQSLAQQVFQLQKDPHCVCCGSY